MGEAPTPGRRPAGPRASWALLLLLAAVSLFPNPRAALPGLAYYFRDFSMTYIPLRDFFTREAAAGRWPFWNPYLHEGCPFLPMFYPGELVQLLWPGPAFASWLLTMHFPLAALAMWALARELGADRVGAFAAGTVYALGGLAQSSLALHWFLQALALTPLVALTIRRAALRGGRGIPIAALVLALAISTLAVEFVIQGLLLGVTLALCAAPPRPAAARLSLACAATALLAALPIALTLGIARESLRGDGLPAEMLLRRAMHPVQLLQVLIPDLCGSISEPLRHWWCGRLVESGPYFMSLYLGPVVLAAAAAGAAALPRRLRVALLGLAGLGLWHALGAPFGLAPLVAEALPWFRFPVKAYLLPHFAAALLAGFGVDRLRRGEVSRPFRRVLLAASVLAVIPALAILWDGAGLAAWLDISPEAEAMMRATILRECGEALLLAAAAAALALAVSRGRLSGRQGALVLAAALAADLSRASAGLNPQAASSFYEAVPGLAANVSGLDGGRIFSFGVDKSAAIAALSATRRPGLEFWSFFLSRQVLNPFANLLEAVESAEGPDRLSFIPNAPALGPWEYDPGAVASVLPRLRAEAVTRLLSLDPLVDPALSLRARIPAGPAGLGIHVYDLTDPWPRAYVACRAVPAGNRAAALAAPLTQGFDPRRDAVLEQAVPASCHEARVVSRSALPGEESYEVEADGAAILVTRDSYTASWHATVDGAPSRVLREGGRHRAVPVPAGRHNVVLKYHPPGLRAGLAGTMLGVLALLALWVRPVLVEE